MEETIEELAKLTFLKSFLQTPRIENPGLSGYVKVDLYPTYRRGSYLVEVHASRCSLLAL